MIAIFYSFNNFIIIIKNILNMESIANEKKRSLYAPSKGMVDHANQIKGHGSLEKGGYVILINISLQSTAENMYVGYVIYRRLSDGTYCILAKRNTGECYYYSEV